MTLTDRQMVLARRGSLALAMLLALSNGWSSAAPLGTPNPTPALINAPATNAYYLSNRAPLVASRLVPLPIGAVKAQGWLRVYLERQGAGLTGHLGEISAWLQKDNNAWLSRDGHGEYGWEEVPYWLRGFLPLAYLLDDPRMIAEAHTWIEHVLTSQHANGDFGPDQRVGDGNRDYWANMVMLYCLQTYYERTQDRRVIELMTRYFHHQLSVPEDKFLTDYWQHMRGGDNLYLVYWLYNMTGDAELLKLGDKLHRRTARWAQHESLPDWHNVNISQAFREPATYFLQTHDADLLQATYDVHHNVRKLYGQVPGGMFGADEVARRGYDDPRQGIETCGMVEQMLSDELLMSFTGDAAWGDHCEEVAFNTYPAAVMPDFRSLRYLTSPNLVVSDSKNHAPGIFNSGPFLMMNPFSSRCCQHNHSQGWPYFTKHLWMATPDNGLCAALYAASEVTAKVGDGTEVHVVEETHYPFEESLRFTVHVPKSLTFPLYFRIPAWCAAAQLTVNGQPMNSALTPGQFARVDRAWSEGDRIELKLPMSLSVRRWTKNHDSISVDYGPLTFSLKIQERWERHDSDSTAIGDSRWQPGVDKSKWPSYELQPSSPWNYGLVVDQEHPERSFELRARSWPDDHFPFTPDNVPIELTARAKRIPQWTLDRYGLCAPLQDSPVKSDEAVETVALIPMGAARLRISSFPIIGDGAGAHTWVEPPRPAPPAYPTSASHTFSTDTTDALSDTMLPASSGDETIPRFTWWPRQGSTEWVQYDFPNERTITSARVYWFDDTGHGRCRVPARWRLLYRQGDQWVPVAPTAAATSYGVARDQWNVVEFQEVRTRGLRLEADLQPDHSGGILEWQVP